jgi:polysaccharide pyruvyl transferase WcaK-like protein
MAGTGQKPSGHFDAASQNVSNPDPGQPIRRFGLVSPWAGGNLGNSAILSAVMLNINKRNPAIEFVGITLNSMQARRRFGIEGFPLAATRYDYARWTTMGAEVQQRRFSVRAVVKAWLKRIPSLRRFGRAVRTWRDEIVHIAGANSAVRRLDAIIVPGGGALDEFWGGPWGHPWNLFKWSVLSRVHRVPFLIVSVGKCSLERPASRLFVRTALKLATYRSYRDPESKQGVQALIDAAPDLVLPDLAFSYPTPFVPKRPVAEAASAGLTVGLSPIAYGDPRVWPIKDGKRYAAYVGQLVQVVKWLLAEGHRLFFFATDSPDLDTIEDVLNGIDRSAMQTGAVWTLPGPIEQTIDQHLEAMRAADVTIASRLHGVILSHLVATPVLAISYDPKVVAQMIIARQTDYCLDIEAFGLNIFMQRFEALKIARRREEARLRSDASRFRQQLDSQYDRILNLCRSGNEAPTDSLQSALAS